MPDTITISRECAEFYRLFVEKARDDRVIPIDKFCITELEAALRSDDGWVTVDEQHPLPDDLKVGDGIAYVLGNPEGRRLSQRLGPITHYRRASKEVNFPLSSEMKKEQASLIGELEAPYKKGKAM